MFKISFLNVKRRISADVIGSRAMDSPMTICGDFAENDANIITGIQAGLPRDGIPAISLESREGRGISRDPATKT